MIKAFPPNYKEVVSFLGEDNNAIFAYDGEIYNPFWAPIDEGITAHEETHLRQQDNYGNRQWWYNYLREPGFRIEQEKEAYLEQFKVGRRTLKDRNKVAEFRRRLATALSSELYGSAISYEEAWRVFAI